MTGRDVFPGGIRKGNGRNWEDRGKALSETDEQNIEPPAAEGKGDGHEQDLQDMLRHRARMRSSQTRPVLGSRLL